MGQSAAQTIAYHRRPAQGQGDIAVSSESGKTTTRFQAMLTRFRQIDKGAAHSSLKPKGNLAS